MSIERVSKEIAGRTLTIETGRMAKQAGGAVTLQYGETIVFCAATTGAAREGIDFFPLTVDYRESLWAAGKFPGGFFKREGRPSEKEILTCRMIDRPIRPLFPDGFFGEVQVLSNAASFDNENDTDIVAMNAAFAALEISDIPFAGGLAAVRIGKNEDGLIVNPTIEECETSSMNFVVAGTRDSIVMVEGGADEESEEAVLEAFELAQNVIREIIDVIAELRERAGKPKIEVPEIEKDGTLEQKVRDFIGGRYQEACFIQDKHERQAALDTIAEETIVALSTRAQEEYAAALPENVNQREAIERIAVWSSGKELAELKKKIKEILHNIEAEILRQSILAENRRADGRKTDEIRPIHCEVGVLPRTHGSALFTRGQTQALVNATLGTVSDEQKIDGLTEEFYKKFMLHYNFPPYCVGETRMIRGPGRREIGHGALAERALRVMLPDSEDFPYTMRIVSDIMESNGSSSMASVCGGALALMDAGVPIKAPVAGIAMGLIKEGDRFAVLSDILGVEDHLGDMDFKVTGTRDGITAFQMDLKISGVTREIMAQALEQARKGRIHILDKMAEALAGPREEISPHAPRIIQLMIPVDKIRDVIGPGGKMIREITMQTGAKIDIDDDGRVIIASIDAEAGISAKEWIEMLTEEVEVGKLYTGKVTRILNFGVFVEILPGKEGMVHISDLAEGRVGRCEDVVEEGDEITVKVAEIDDLGRVNLSKKMADRELGITAPEDYIDEPPRSSRGPRNDRGGRGGGGGRDRDRGGRDRGPRGGGGGGGRDRDRGPRGGGGGRDRGPRNSGGGGRDRGGRDR